MITRWRRRNQLPSQLSPALSLPPPKTGPPGHFRSKEDLQLATIDAAAEMFDREVMQPGRAAPPGVRRVLSYCEACFQYLERAVFPGGCFFVAAAAELDAKKGPVRDHLREAYSRILQGLVDVVRERRSWANRCN